MVKDPETLLAKGGDDVALLAVVLWWTTTSTTTTSSSTTTISSSSRQQIAFQVKMSLETPRVELPFKRPKGRLRAKGGPRQVMV